MQEIKFRRTPAFTQFHKHKNGNNAAYSFMISYSSVLQPLISLLPAAPSRLPPPADGGYPMQRPPQELMRSSNEDSQGGGHAERASEPAHGHLTMGVAPGVPLGTATKHYHERA